MPPFFRRKMKGAKFMKKFFGALPDRAAASLYTLSCGPLSAAVTDYGAALVRLLVPDRAGETADVVLGFDDWRGYSRSTACLGATVGRNANRTRGARFSLNGQDYALTPNENGNNLHSGPDFFHTRLWQVTAWQKNAIRLELHSPQGDQGFPGDARIAVTYTLEESSLRIAFEGRCDRDTVFNMTNHSYFNLAGHSRTEAAMGQLLTLPGRFFLPDDAQSIPTGELRPVAGSPMDFRSPKPLGRDIDLPYEPLLLQGGYDHCWEAFGDPCAILSDPVSGRSMAVSTDCPGIQVYTGNFLDDAGKDGVYYGPRSGVALETQFYPDSLHHSDWPQPITRAGQIYHSETVLRFSW